jgi:hypothetical protein
MKKHLDVLHRKIPLETKNSPTVSRIVIDDRWTDSRG